MEIRDLFYNLPARLKFLKSATTEGNYIANLLDKIALSHPEISSTSELVFRLICQLGNFSDITKEGAECIYTGMMTDTGGFTYSSNDREIYLIIGELLSKGIDKDEIYRNVYSENNAKSTLFVR